MNAIIGYSCTRAEWETLRLLLELSLPLGVSETPLDKDACQEAYDSLCAAGILTPVGGKVHVDQLYSFLLAELSESSLCLTCRSEGRHVQLFRGSGLLILCEWTVRNCTMTPVQDPASARDPLLNAFSRCSVPLTLELMRENTLLDSLEFDSAESARRGLDGMFQAFASLAGE